MALFNKKLSLDEILKAIEGLSEEDKAKVKAKMDEGAPVEETPEVENVEEQADNTAEGESEQPEQVGEEVEEQGALVEEVPGEEQPTEQPTPEGEMPPETEELDGVEQDNKDEVISGLVDRVQALEEKLAELNELKGLMEQFTKKQADSFGYKGAVPGAKKDIHDMSASELKEKMLNGEI